MFARRFDMMSPFRKNILSTGAELAGIQDSLSNSDCSMGNSL